MNKEIERIIDDNLKKYEFDCPFQNCIGIKKTVEELVDNLRAVLFPFLFGMNVSTKDYLIKIYEILNKVVPITDKEVNIDLLFTNVISGLDTIKEVLDTDVEAAYEGDPACKNKLEVVLAYPGFGAITIYRIAHLFYLNKAEIISRMMTEYAHKLTGIDIHPGATIGTNFFIDHGTGVVIGETTIIGNNVKIYQGVTLGAKSFKKTADGKLVKGIKRHPNIEDDVIIYANATILGGDTTIGKGSVIGGNAWITESVPPYSRVVISTNK